MIDGARGMFAPYVSMTAMANGLVDGNAKRDAGLQTGLTQQWVIARLKQCGWECWWCEGPFQNWDHLQPVVLGGPAHIDNLVPCCYRCNMLKGGTELFRWLEQPGALPVRREIPPPIYTYDETAPSWTYRRQPRPWANSASAIRARSRVRKAAAAPPPTPTSRKGSSPPTASPAPTAASMRTEDTDD